MVTVKLKKPEMAERRTLEQKLGKVHFQAGWAAMPNVLFQRQRALGLDSLDINIIMVLTTYWWHLDDKPYPSKQVIAKAIGCDVSTVRKRIQKLEQGGLIRRIPRRLALGGSSSNAYDLAPLLKAAEPYSQEELVRRAERKRENLEKLSRKRPRLKIVAE